MSIIAAIGAGMVTAAFCCVAILIIEFVDEVRQDAAYRMRETSCP